MTWAPAVALVMSPIAFIGSACFLGIEFHQAYSSGLIEYVSEFWNWIQVQPRDHATHPPYSPHVTQPYHLTITLRCPQFTGYGSQFAVTSYYFYLFAFLGRHRWVVHAHDLPEGHTQFVQTLSAFSVLIMFFSCFFYARGFDQWRVPEP